jgi:hypothetical protein
VEEDRVNRKEAGRQDRGEGCSVEGNKAGLGGRRQGRGELGKGEGGREEERQGSGEGSRVERREAE